MEFLGSPDCKNVVGEKAVVFPAIPQATDKAEAAFKAKGIDVSSFLDTTFLSRSLTTLQRSTASCIRPWMTSCLARPQPHR
jgi:hypothetical protein